MKSNIPYKLSVKQKRRMLREIGRQVDEQILDLDSIMLYAVAQYTGRKKRGLRKFFSIYNDLYYQVQKHYHYDEAPDIAYACRQKLLLEYGIDVREWEDEEQGKRNAERK